MDQQGKHFQEAHRHTVFGLWAKRWMSRRVVPRERASTVQSLRAPPKLDSDLYMAEKQPRVESDPGSKHTSLCDTARRS